MLIVIPTQNTEKQLFENHSNLKKMQSEPSSQIKQLGFFLNLHGKNKHIHVNKMPHIFPKSVPTLALTGALELLNVEYCIWLQGERVSVKILAEFIGHTDAISTEHKADEHE